MPAVIDPETMPVDELPGIWSPVQWELTEEERSEEIQEQATASLLWTVNAPEAILRLLLQATEIARSYGPPKGYDPEQQGEWNDEIITFQFAREVKLLNIEREQDYLYVEYEVEDWGTWAIEIETEAVSIWRI
jgi:hypothetical protein